MNLANPYGDGNHRRISWRREWDVNVEALTATHRTTGFTVRFQPLAVGGYLMEIATPVTFGPLQGDAIAQAFGLRELLKDGWEIFHTAAKRSRPQS